MSALLYAAFTAIGSFFPNCWIDKVKKIIKVIDSKCLSSSKTGKRKLDEIDGLNGYQFEEFCADLLRENGFVGVQLTLQSGDQGVDILAEKDGVRYAFQCKHYSSPLGNSPVQEVNAGKAFYKCHVAVVITNSTFTRGAKELAEATGVLLWDRAVVQTMLGENL